MSSPIPILLRTDSHFNPLAVSSEPRLSWTLGTTDRSVQRAYQVQAASSEEALRANRADLWDSARVSSPNNHLISYGGRMGHVGESHWWRVRIWTEDGADPSPWSEPAFFERGPATLKEWGAQWIGGRGMEPFPCPLQPGVFVWHPSIPPGSTARFTLEFTSGQGLQYARARLVIDGCCSFFVNGSKIGSVDAAMTVHEFEIADQLTPGGNCMVIEAVGHSAGAGVALGLGLYYTRDRHETYTLETGAFVHAPGLDAPQPVVIQPQYGGGKDWYRRSARFAPVYPAPYLRKTFEVGRSVARARAYVCGLGYGELYINGARVGDSVLNPAQTDYDRYALYDAYDLTALVHRGPNVAGIVLGNGWYNQYTTWGGLSYGAPAAVVRIELEHEDGTRTALVSDETWRTSTGPILANNIYGGETFDARLEQADWSTPAFDDTAWLPAQVQTMRTPRLQPQLLPPIRKTDRLTPVGFHASAPRTWVFDFGRNFTGWCRLHLDEPAGTVVRLRFCEVLYPDGTPDFTSTGVFATWVTQEDVYTCRGGGAESWEPRFTCHGFRYVEIHGLTRTPRTGTVEGIVVHTDAPEAGRFECADALLNRVHAMAVQTERSNLHGVPTDCPHRERCGWLGDAHVTAEMSIYNWDMERFWDKYLDDVLHSINQSAAIADAFSVPSNIAPGKRRCGHKADWEAALVFIPWFIYLYYGDDAPARRAFPHIQRWLAYMEHLSPDGILRDGHGDWCPPGRILPECPVPLSSTALYFSCLKHAERFGRRFNHVTLADYYHARARRVREAFNQAFLDRTACSYGTQTANAMALEYGLTPVGLEDRVASRLAADILDAHQGHFNTGIHGLLCLFDVLCRYHRDDVAWHVIQQTRYPSFAHHLGLGATTFWESFYASVQECDAQERSMSHPMQGGFDKWFYAGVAGIRPDPEAPGFRRLAMRPALIQHLDWARATYRSASGMIESAWRWQDTEFHWQIQLPPGTTAAVYLPHQDSVVIECDGRTVATVGQAAGDHTEVTFTLHPGPHRILAKNLS